MMGKVHFRPSFTPCLFIYFPDIRLHRLFLSLRSINLLLPQTSFSFMNINISFGFNVMQSPFILMISDLIE